MHSGRQVDATTVNLRIAAECHTGLRVVHLTEPDTRRFGTIFPLEAPDTVTIDSSSTTQEEQNDSDDLSRFEFVAAFDMDTSTSQVTSPAIADDGSTLSAAQQIIACYRAVHGNDHTPKYDSVETEEKDLPQIPVDRHSMYTLATTTDTQSIMDMTWRPQPKVHMRCADQRALMQAQTQAIAMMHNAGLRPTDKIQCRRRGCADILTDVKALKYHLHIHNIADLTARRRDGSSSSARKPPPVGYNISNPGALKRNHSRSKSSLEIHHKYSTISPPPRKLSAGSLLPSLLSRESSPEASMAPSFTTVAKALAPESSAAMTCSLPARNEILSSPIATPSRGRKQKKESLAISVSTPCNPNIAMLLSPPSSPIPHDRPMLVPRVNLPKPLSPGPTRDAGVESCIYIRNESTPSVHTGSRSPVRPLSPTRAMSPIRNGIKRILSMASPDNVHDA